MSSNREPLPRWDLGTIYPGSSSPEFLADLETLRDKGEGLERLVEEAPDGTLIADYLDMYNEVADLFETLYAFAYGMYSTDTNSAAAMELINRLETLKLPMGRAGVRFRKRLGRGCPIPDKLRADYGLYFDEQLHLVSHQMSVQEEDLAADLARSGADAWGRLQEAISSNLKSEWNIGDERTVVQLRALAFDSDREVREKAFHLELKAWESVRMPLAFALNGVKGHSITVNTKRKYGSTLERSRDQNRISQKALDAMIGVMKDSLPVFRTYLKAKATLLGLSRLAFFDLFAPVGESERKWSFAEAREFICTQFGAYSSSLSDFTDHAFANGWIDAEPREGKVGGAYCMGVPNRRETRILCNFDGSFSAVTTLAHELGHAYHHHLLRDATHIHRDYPMTLAETASIFAENLLVSQAVEQFEESERLVVLEAFLADSTQVVVDILSRFLFESALLDRRQDTDLSPDDLNKMMREAQEQTYGEALDPGQLHPYMWAVKGHYYSHELAYYNYPYAFGLLFALGLLKIYHQQGSSFVPRYDGILVRTGRAGAVELTGEVGFDIERAEFWRGSIAMIAERVDQFQEVVKSRKEV